MLSFVLVLPSCTQQSAVWCDFISCSPALFWFVQVDTYTDRGRRRHNDNMVVWNIYKATIENKPIIFDDILLHFMMIMIMCIKGPKKDQSVTRSYTINVLCIHIYTTHSLRQLPNIQFHSFLSSLSIHLHQQSFKKEKSVVLKESKGSSSSFPNS